MNITWAPMRTSKQMIRGIRRDQYFSAKKASGGVAAAKLGIGASSLKVQTHRVRGRETRKISFR
jgi:hypothetical protein